METVSTGQCAKAGDIAHLVSTSLQLGQQTIYELHFPRHLYDSFRCFVHCVDLQTDTVSTVHRRLPDKNKGDTSSNRKGWLQILRICINRFLRLVFFPFARGGATTLGAGLPPVQPDS